MANKIFDKYPVSSSGQKVRALGEDFNDTYQFLLSPVGILAEQAYKTLAASLSYENVDNTAAEDFTSAGGANGTVNQDIIDSISGDTTTISGFINTANAFDGDENTNSSLSTTGTHSGNVGKTFSAKYIAGANVTYDYFSSDKRGNGSIVVQTYNGSIWTTIQTLFSHSYVASAAHINVAKNTVFVYVSDTIQGIRVLTSFTWDGSYSNTTKVYELVAGVSLTTAVFNVDKYECQGGAGYYSDSVIVCDGTGTGNTLAVDDETNAFALHWQGDFPTNTSGSFDLEDGSGNIINLPVNPIIKKTGVIEKGTLTNTDNVIIKAKLATTDTSVTPTINGFAIVKL